MRKAKAKAEAAKPSRFAKWRQADFWLPVLSAILVLLAFPPFNFVVLLFFGLAPLLYSLKSETTGKGAFKAGNRFGFVYMLGQLLFIFILALRWTGNPALALIPWLACALVGQLFFGLTGVIIFRAFRASELRGRWMVALLIPIIWAGVEVFRSQLPFLGFPWGLLATPLWRYPILIGLARFLTVYGLTAWVVGVNLVVMGAATKDFKTVRRFSIVSIGLLGISLLQFYKGLDPISDNVRVFCVQPGVDQAFGDAKVQEDAQAQNIDLLLDEAVTREPDLIVLPEGVARLGDEPVPIPPFTLPSNAAIIFGAQRGTGPIYQSVYSHDQSNNWTHADKTRLVIFGEYVPGRNLFGFLDNFHLASADITPGKKSETLTVDFPKIGRVKIGALICYEGLFYDLAAAQSANGARMLAVVSIDDWFMDSPAPEQLEAAAVFRSVETNLPTVRAASTGYTMACNNKGELLAEVPIQHMHGMPVTISVPLFPQPSWWLSIFPIASVLITFGLWVVTAWIDKRASGGNAS